MWLLSDLCNVIYINPKDVMRLSSPQACFLYYVVRSAGIEVPSDTNYLTEEERSELNTRKPRYVSCVYKHEMIRDDFRLPRIADVVMSIKVEGDQDIFVWSVRSDHRTKAQEVTSLCYSHLGDIMLTGGPANIEVDWIYWDLTSYDYKLVEWVMEKTWGKRLGYLTLLSKIRTYVLIELGLNINVVDMLMYNMITTKDLTDEINPFS